MLKNLSFKLKEIKDQDLFSVKRLNPFLFLIAQLLMITHIINSLEIESEMGLQKISYIILGGFAISYWMSIRFRLPFFILLTIISLGFLIKFQVLILLAILCFYLLIAHLNISFNIRFLLILIITAILACIRMQYIVTPNLNINNMLTILGAMMSFRMILYLYELKYTKKSFSIWESFSYFLMLPNVVLLLFPIVDYKKFTRFYFNTNEVQIYQRGITRILRGIVLVILYRTVNFYFAIPSENVDDIYSLIQYVLLSYSVMLRLGGILWISIGILHLFGFNLPKIMDNFYLSTSFNDYWRRTNIYYKDFINKVFYNPSYFIFKKYGASISIVISIVIAFSITWALHSWQFLWLQGVFPIKSSDLIFWAVFCVSLILNSLYENNVSKKVLSKKWTISNAIIYSLKLLGTNIFLGLLWALWSSTSITDYLLTISHVTIIPDFLAFSLLISCVFVLIVFLNFIDSKFSLEKILSFIPLSTFNNNKFMVSVSLVLLVLLGNTKTIEFVKDKSGFSIEPIVRQKMNELEMKLRQQGYYEELLTTSYNILKGSESVINNENLTDDWRVPFDETPACKITRDLIEKNIVPNVTIKYKGSIFSSNEWGFRDKYYSKEKPLNTIRIAIMGASIEMGSGVDNDKVFENLLEEKLNLEEEVNYEILNFSIPGYQIPQQYALLESKVVEFNPDYVFLFYHSSDKFMSSGVLRRLFKRDADMIYAKLDTIKEEFRKIKTGDKNRDIFLIEKKYSDDVLNWAVNSFVNTCSINSITPVIVYGAALKTLDPKFKKKQKERFLEIKKISNKYNITVLNIADCFEDYTLEELSISSRDNHPNPKGHEIMSNALLDEMYINEKALGLNFTSK